MNKAVLDSLHTLVMRNLSNAPEHEFSAICECFNILQQSLTNPLDEAVRLIEASLEAVDDSEVDYIAGARMTISIIQSIKEGKTNE